MHMAAAVAAAWVAWAEWICNTAQTVVAIKERAGFGPLFFFWLDVSYCASPAGNADAKDESTGQGVSHRPP
jgi:hypothetical protein